MCQCVVCASRCSMAVASPWFAYGSGAAQAVCISDCGLGIASIIVHIYSELRTFLSTSCIVPTFIPWPWLPWPFRMRCVWFMTFALRLCGAASRAMPMPVSFADFKSDRRRLAATQRPISAMGPEKRRMCLDARRGNLHVDVNAAMRISRLCKLCIPAFRVAPSQCPHILATLSWM